MHTYTLRLKPNQDLRSEMDRFVAAHDIKAGVVLSLVGSLKTACLRVNGGHELQRGGPFEIVGVTGTVSVNGSHVHISIADKDGAVIGGHLKHGCVVHTTVELVVGHLIGEEYKRELDDQTGYDELIAN